MRRAIALLALTVLALGSMQVGLSAREVVLRTGLNGEREVPGPGDPNGEGRARIVVDSEAGSICYRVTFSRIGRAKMAHIHRGRKGVAGDVVVTLWSTSEGSPAMGCVDVKSGLADRIQSHPRRYYVNLHTREYPDGAIRGNLTPAG
jgi:CHRD domain-containing protein